MTYTASAAAPRRAALSVLVALSATHLLNDMIQSLIPATYPILRDAYRLDYVQIGVITFAFQVSASLLQPLVGFYTDKRPTPYLMVAGMGASLAGLVGLAYAGSYPLLVAAAALVGLGSSIFHPEATRMARDASGGRQGLAQGIFQVGGQAGTALGPLLAAFVIVPRGQGSLSAFTLAALAAIALMIWTIGRAEPAPSRRTASPAERGAAAGTASSAAPGATSAAAGGGGVLAALAILIVLLFSKTAYQASFTSFYTFYLIDHFGVSVQTSQVMLFLFLASAAVGVLGGGLLGDRFGRRGIIWFSILGALPFTLLLPHVGLFWTGVLTIVVSLIMSSAFAAILVYAMELLPRQVGLIGGFFYGLSFGLGGIAAAGLGALADRHGIAAVYGWCAYLPAIGLLAWFLPRPEGLDAPRRA